MADKWTNQTTLNVCIILVFIILSSYALFIINNALSENSNLERARDFHIRISYNFSDSPVYALGSSPDIEFDLEMHYPRGTLIVDDPVDISGVAVLNSLRAQKVRMISIAFQGAQEWPVTQNNKGITNETNLCLWKIQDNKLMGKTTMVWALEGIYYPRATLQFVDGTSQPTLSSDVSITVYPKSQFAQIVTNKAILLLAIPTFLLAFGGIFKYILALIGEILRNSK